MVVTGKCSKEGCDETIDCVEGCPERSECEFWDSDDLKVDNSAVLDELNRVPWHGGSLVEHDINLISTHRRPYLVALIGPHDAGKTTYLAALHLLCCRQKLNQDLNFAGSLTLLGWERIVASMKYPTPGNPSPSYPPHTSHSAERTPGMLHYSFRTDCGNKRDLLFTDAPGEWFSNWANDPTNPKSEGAAWTVKHADSFLFFVDRDSLSNNPKNEKGVARNQIESLAARLAEHRGSRSVGVIWSKSDIEISETIKTSVWATLKNEMPDAQHFHTTITPKNGVVDEITNPLIESFSFAIDPIDKQIAFSPDIPTIACDDRFLSYRGDC